MKFKVVIIDDEPDLCDLFVDMYTSTDVEVTYYLNPIEALKGIRCNPPNLIFLDYILPGMDGEEFARALEIDIPIILVSGDINLHCNFNFVTVITKPYHPDVIQEFIDRFKTKNIGHVSND